MRGWLACAQAVEGQDGVVDQKRLLEAGWRPLQVVVDDGPTPDSGLFFYTEPTTNALIYVFQDGCTVEGFASSVAALREVMPQISEHVAELAKKRGVKFQQRPLTDNIPVFSAKAGSFGMIGSYRSNGKGVLGSLFSEGRKSGLISITTSEVGRSSK